jgi:hypothetical protein
LIITIPTTEHEGLHRGLDRGLDFDAASMGLRREFVSIGSATFMDKDANGNITSEGEGDSCRKPKSMRTNKHQYPTLMIEAGWSDSAETTRESKVVV